MSLLIIPSTTLTVLTVHSFELLFQLLTLLIVVFCTAVVLQSTARCSVLCVLYCVAGATATDRRLIRVLAIAIAAEQSPSNARKQDVSEKYHINSNISKSITIYQNIL